MKRVKFIFLFGICILGFLLRMYEVDSIPSGFHADEAAFGYNAFSLLKTGKDEYGKAFPLVLRSFDDYKGAVYSYVTILFIQVFGLSEWSVRIPSVLSGIGIIILTFLIVKKMTKRESIAYLSSCLVAVTPMFILLSRVQSDPLLAMFFVLSGLYFFLRWVEDRHIGYLLAVVFSWMIAICTYYSPWLFLFSFIIFLFWYFRKELSLSQKIQGIIVYGCLLGLAAYLLTSLMSTRVSQVSIFQKPDITAVLEEEIREDVNGNLPSSVARLFHNKPYDYGRFLIYNYARFLDFDFLFYQASEPARERIPNSGVFYLIDAPFLLFGIYVIFRKRYRWGNVFLLWFFLVPALSVFAVDETPNVHRFVLAGVPEAAIVSLSIVELYRVLKKKILQYGFILIVIGLYIVSLIVFMHQLFFHQPVHYPFYRDYSYKGLVENIMKRYDSYTVIVVTQDKGNAYIHFLFHLRYDPSKYLSSGSTGNEPFGRFDKFIFVPMKCPTEEELARTGKVPMDSSMLIVKGGKCPEMENERIIDTVPWADGSEAFQLVEY